MTKPNKKYVVKKFDGDDAYSYAVFDKQELVRSGLFRNTIIFFGQAQPLVEGCSRTQAMHYKSEFEQGGAGSG